MFRAHESAERDRLVAVKVFRLDLTPEQASRLVAELNLLAAKQIAHPNIAAPLAAGLEHGEAYLAQEHAVGDSLDVVLRDRGPMTIEEMVALVSAGSAAIDHAAARGVRHSSLHMRDILVSPGGIRITGFGVAQALDHVGARLPTRPEFSSPDDASDVYSLAAIAFQAVTGRRASPERLEEFAEANGEELAGPFRAALAVDPGARPASASMFAASLARAVGRTPETSAAETVTAVEQGRADVPPAVETASASDREIELEMDRHPDGEVAADLDVMRPDATADLHEADVAARDPEPRFVDFDEDFDERTPEPQEREVFGRGLHAADETDASAPSQRWALVLVLMAVAVLAALAVSLFVRAPAEEKAERAQTSGVEGTTVDVPPAPPAAPRDPASASRDRAASPPPAPASPPRAVAPPAPAPSRPASGAVPAAEPGRLLIRSTPGGAAVIVNGVARGETPLAVRDLAPGSYTIRIARDGYAVDERTMQITAARPAASASFDLRPLATSRSGAAGAMPPGAGQLVVQSRPAGARVFVNGRDVGATPVTIPDVPAGSVGVRIELAGYRTWATSVMVGTDGPTRVAASLERP